MGRADLPTGVTVSTDLSDDHAVDMYGRRLAALAVSMIVLVGCRGAAAPSAAAGPVLADIGAGLQGPPGLAATVYAQGLPKVSAFAWDAQGALWMASADYTDAGRDGVYVTTELGASPKRVIANLHTPLGLAWYRSELYVSSKGGVAAYSGFDGTSFSRARTVVSLPAGLGEVNGIALAPDGRFWLGISAPSDHAAGTSEYSAAVVSFLPDGTDLRVEASGIRAPVGLAFYPGTSDLFVTMNQRDDLGEQTPGDWLAMVQAGDKWGFPDCYGQGGSVCSGVPSPTADLDRHAAVSGVAIVTGELGSTIGTAGVVAEWALGKVLRVSLEKVGSSYVGTVQPFLTGLKNPVPVAVGPDGALFVGDWTSGIVYRVAPAVSSEA